jgi:hypothetical protein
MASRVVKSQRKRKPLKAPTKKSSLHAQLSAIANEIARYPKTGKKADKKFFDELSGD